MLTVIVCVGSSCSVRGAEKVAATFERLIRQGDLAAQVELTGAFCMEHCCMGVSVRVEDQVYYCVDPAEAESFFQSEILPRLGCRVAA